MSYPTRFSQLMRSRCLLRIVQKKRSYGAWCAVCGPIVMRRSSEHIRCRDYPQKFGKVWCGLVWFSLLFVRQFLLPTLFRYPNLTQCVQLDETCILDHFGRWRYGNSISCSQQKNRGFDHGIWPKTAVFEVAATPLGHQRSHRPAVGVFLTFVKARAGVWSKFVPDLVATGHPCQFHLFGTFYIGTTSACTGPCLWISFAKLGGRESATRILEFKDRKRASGLVKGKALGLASFVRL